MLELGAAVERCAITLKTWPGIILETLIVQCHLLGNANILRIIPVTARYEWS